MKPFNYYDLVEGFRERTGCAVCNLVERDVARFLDSHLYEYVNTRETHALFRASRGLCAIHSAQLSDYGASVLGIAILHAGVLDEVLNIVAGGQATAGRSWARLRGSKTAAGQALADKLEAIGPCMACEALERAQGMHIETLTAYLGEDELQTAYRESQGLCLPHFGLALRVAKLPILETLVEIQTGHWQRLKAELDTFSDKYDINHADEAMGSEGDSWRRATRLVGGEGSIFGRG